MRKVLPILFLVVACASKKHAPKALVKTYYKGFINSNYNQIRETLADSINIVEGAYKMSFTPESFYKQYKWDSVFKPVYNIIELKKKQEYIIATVAVSSLRFDFLKNTR